MSREELVNNHYGVAGLMAAIEAGLMSVGKNLDSLTVDDLAPVDEFHSRGREATAELASLAKIKATDQVLDVGCGIGGTARYLAHQFGCCVTGIDLTDEFVTVGQRLTELVGLTDRVALRQGSALALPFEVNSFDIAWTEHAQMNIADKKQFYSEIARVLKPGGRLLFHDIFRGDGEEPIYPLPWAEDESISSLATVTEARAAMEQAGLVVEQWADKVGDTLAFMDKMAAQAAAGQAPPISIRLVMRDNGQKKLANYVRGLKEKRLAVALGMARKGEAPFTRQ